MADINIQSLNVSIAEKKILTDFNFFAADNTVTGILAPSGFGKTTLLNWIAGLLGKEYFCSFNPEYKNVSYVFQEPRLIPNLTVFENVYLPLKKVMRKAAAEQQVKEFLEKVDMYDKKDVAAANLSGGEAHRVSIARAFAYPSEILLLDEPFQSLDKELRVKILENIKSIISQIPRTVIFVSHNEDELNYLCDYIVKYENSN